MQKHKPSLGVYVLLALFFGGVGFHRFYEGKVLSGIFMLLFFWTGVPAFVALVDIFTAFGARRDSFA